MGFVVMLGIVMFALYSAAVLATAAGWRLPRWPLPSPREKCWKCGASFVARAAPASDTEAPPSGLELHERATHNPEPIVGSKITMPRRGAWRERRQLEVVTANGTRLRIVRGQGRA